MYMKKFMIALIAVAAMSLLASCAVTTDSTESSSETFENTTDASSDVTSSTSKNDKEEHKAAQLIKYVKSNMARLRADMAVGEGEHLETLAALMSVEPVQKEKFYALTKNHFNELFNAPDTTAEQLLANLRVTMTGAAI